FGVSPESCGGHSYGELTALCAAGRLSPEELFTLSRLRGRLMASGGGDKGTMLAALAPIARVRSAVEEDKLDVVLANKNAPEQVVLSGGTEAVGRAALALEARGIRVTRLSVAAAFHSRLVSDAAGPLRRSLEGAAFPAGSIPVYSNTTAEPYPADGGKAKDLLAGQLACPVEFLSQIENMYRDGARVFLEIGPGARLTGLVRAILGEREHLALALDSSSGKRNGTVDLARALAQLAAAGLAVDLAAWEGGEEGVRALLARPKPKVVVRISGATPLNPKAKDPAPEGRAPSPVGEIRVDEGAVQSLRPSQEGILALQRLQEQASDLHRLYLEGQETAQRALLSLIEAQAFMHGDESRRAFRMDAPAGRDLEDAQRASRAANRVCEGDSAIPRAEA
ncbi:MAG: ACP S-malonyltransferase, partial [Elusimicrobiota bacterium]